MTEPAGIPPRGVPVPSLLGRDHEVARLSEMVSRARAGDSGALVISGEAGIGKTALLDRVVDLAAPDVRVERMVAWQSEMELPYAGLQLMCGHLMAASTELPAPQREALETVFGLRGARAPNPLVVGLAVLGLLARVAGDRALMCIVDDAQWLDDVSARTIASVARRLSSEGVAVVLVMREVDGQWGDLPQLVLRAWRTMTPASCCASRCPARSTHGSATS